MLINYSIFYFQVLIFMIFDIILVISYLLKRNDKILSLRKMEKIWWILIELLFLFWMV